MEYYKKLSKLSDKDFKQIVGVKKETFYIMVEILKSAYVQKHKKGGRNRKLAVKDRLFMTLKSKIKVFKIMKYNYRNRRKRHLLRLNLICGIINFES